MSKNRINVAIAGATGFVGLDLVFLLSKHPNINIKYLCSQSYIGKKINKFDSRIKKKLPILSDIKKVNWYKVDVLFMSLPNGKAQILTKKLFYKFKHLKFIDLSADFRIQSSLLYKKWYNLNHYAKDLINKTLYSISEFSKKEIKNYRIISNPGCYPTSIQLAVNPLLKMIKGNIIIDSKSGYSGAGKNFRKKFPYKNFFSSTYAYSVTKHRHMAEIDQSFKSLNSKNTNYVFNPQIIPTFRGILSCIYLEPKKKYSARIILNKLKKIHSHNPFVKILKLNQNLGTNNVINTNNCEISVCQTRDKNKIIIISALDNLVKGAAGQAIQNMNLMFNLSETKGLK